MRSTAIAVINKMRATSFVENDIGNTTRLTGYGLEDRGAGVRVPVKIVKVFLVLN
jgi:hypothetical protein